MSYPREIANSHHGSQALASLALGLGLHVVWSGDSPCKLAPLDRRGVMMTVRTPSNLHEVQCKLVLENGINGRYQRLDCIIK
jgi:hypothetical protein